MEEERRFCYHCGAILPNGLVQCPECGTLVEGATVDEIPLSNEGSPDSGETMRIPVRSRRFSFDMVAYCILAWSIFALVVGAVNIYAGMSPGTVEGIFEWYRSIGFDPSRMFDGLTPEEIQSRLLIEGLMIFSSGVFAYASAALAKRRTNWKLSMVFCTLSAIFSTGFSSIFCIGLVIAGFYFSYLIYEAKDEFEY